MEMTVSSTAFKDYEPIPVVYTCDGENINPPLTVARIPGGAEALVVVMDDPDLPAQVRAQLGLSRFDHWALYNISIDHDTVEIESGTKIGEAGLNSGGTLGYTGPCPPAGVEPVTHRYFFRVYAIAGTLSFETAPAVAALEAHAKANALAVATLTGTYSRTE